MSLRFRICLAIWIAVVAFAAMTGKVQAQEASTTLTPVPDPDVPVAATANISDEDWTIEIVPARKLSTRAAETDQQRIADQYKSVYAAVPFNRAEYDANPSYRHDSAMEILTGNSRHITVLKPNESPRPLVVPTTRPQPLIPPYGFVRPSLQHNYYRHFPTLNPYYNMFWNY